MTFDPTTARTVRGETLVPGYNLDPIDIGAGLAMLDRIGGGSPETRMVITYALQRWARGEEAAAEKGAIDETFHGIDLTSWRMVLAAAMAGAVAE